MALDIGVDIISFESGHLSEESLGGRLFAVDAEFRHSLLGECLGVFLVDDCEVFGIADAVYLAAQEFDAEAVDCADEIVDTSAVDHAGDPLLHLLGGLVGKGQAEHIARRDTNLIDQKGESMGEHAGLAGAGARHYPDAPFGGLHGPQLVRIQSCIWIIGRHQLRVSNPRLLS